MSRYFNPK